MTARALVLAALALAVALAATPAPAPATARVAASATSPAPQDDGPTVVVGSKPFTENRILAHVFAQLIEARTDARVELDKVI